MTRRIRFAIAAVLGVLIATGCLLLSAGFSPFSLIASAQDSVFVEPQVSVTEEQQVSQSNNSEDKQPRKCEETRILAFTIIENPVWEPETQSYSCCRYVDDEPICPDPPTEASS